jgi:hypothetical protein
MMKKFRSFAEHGYVHLATDSHRSRIWFNGLLDENGEAPVNPLQCADTIEGPEACASFYSFFESYYRALKDEVLAILQRRGAATVHQIIKDFKKSRNPHVRFKSMLAFPRIPSRLDVMVAVILKEEQILRKKEGGRILFLATR